MRVRKDFKRLEGIRSSRLVVIAAEGRDTENIYFEALKNQLESTKVHIEVLHRNNDESSPMHVLEQIRSFSLEYNIEDDDQLWVVVDKDRWPVKMLSSVARFCKQNENYRFCVSNPCFELWLLLHMEDISTYSVNELVALAANRRSSRHGKTWLKKRLSILMNGYDEAKYQAGKLLPFIPVAVERAAKLDTTPRDRWPQTVGTRGYCIITSIFE